MVGGVQVIARYHKKYITRIRSHDYVEKSKLAEKVMMQSCYNFTAQVMQGPVVKTCWL